MIKFMNVISGRCNVEYKIVNLYICMNVWSITVQIRTMFSPDTHKTHLKEEVYTDGIVKR